MHVKALRSCRPHIVTKRRTLLPRRRDMVCSRKSVTIELLMTAARRSLPDGQFRCGYIVLDVLVLPSWLPVGAGSVNGECRSKSLFVATELILTPINFCRREFSKR